MKNALFAGLILASILFGCKNDTTQEPRKLPYMGLGEIVEKTVDGKTVSDTLPYTVPGFRFVDQDSSTITEAVVENKVYVADFFFTSCPTICPIMKKEMKRVHDAFLEDDRIKILSHSLDPEYDTVGVLRTYAEDLGVDSRRWHLMTGPKDSIYYMAKQYMVSAMEDENAPGGYVHSGAFILVDQQRRIRGYYDGTSPEEVDQMIREIPQLFDE
ncbi:MAG: SCO family protein [Bacteroidota bacterium]